MYGPIASFKFDYIRDKESEIEESMNEEIE